MLNLKLQRKKKMKNLKGNTNRVYQYLKTHKGITSMQAFELFEQPDYLL